MLPERTTMTDIAEWVRGKFPDAVSVRLFVGANHHEIETSYRDKSDGISMKALDGSWAVTATTR